jgi:membrane protein DedA with SNARE-associated domain
MESLTSLMSMLAAGSILAVLGATLLERLIPILPSYLLLLSIGIAAARFDGSLIEMIFASVFASVLGCGFYYYAASTLDSVRARRWGNRLARLSGVSQRRMRRLLVALRRNAPPLSLLSQLVPGLRLVSPGMAGAAGIPALTYLPFAAIGIAIWNLFFISAGYFATLRNPQADAASIALAVVGIFISIEATVGALWWALRRYRRASAPVIFLPKTIVV